MKRLTVAQLNQIKQGKGLFDDATWQACLEFLHVSIDDSDPANSSVWNASMQLLQSFLHWTLTECESKFGTMAYQCLELASSQNLDDEFIHEKKDAVCIFSGRREPKEYKMKRSSAQFTPSTRLHRRFYVWSYHKVT